MITIIDKKLDRQALIDRDNRLDLLEFMEHQKVVWRPINLLLKPDEFGVSRIP